MASIPWGHNVVLLEKVNPAERIWYIQQTIEHGWSREAHRRGEKLELSEEELAFYEALAANDSAVKVLGDETLRELARELVKTVRQNVTIDWTVRESARAKLRVMVKHLLRKYGYPPDKQEKTTQTVLKQAELFGWEVSE